MSKSCQEKRVIERHGTTVSDDYKKKLFKFAEFCEPACVDELNAYNININKDMTSEEVIQNILPLLEANHSLN